MRLRDEFDFFTSTILPLNLISAVIIISVWFVSVCNKYCQLLSDEGSLPVVHQVKCAKEIIDVPLYGICPGNVFPQTLMTNELCANMLHEGYEIFSDSPSDYYNGGELGYRNRCASGPITNEYITNSNISFVDMCKKNRGFIAEKFTERFVGFLTENSLFILLFLLMLMVVIRCFRPIVAGPVTDFTSQEPVPNALRESTSITRGLHELYCPISRDLMQHPVTFNTGHSVDAVNARRLVRCPMTNEDITVRVLNSLLNSILNLVVQQPDTTLRQLTGIEDVLKCPHSGEMMKDPFIIVPDERGQPCVTYDLESIIQNPDLSNKRRIRNIAVEQIIGYYHNEFQSTRSSGIVDDGGTPEEVGDVEAPVQEGDSSSNRLSTQEMPGRRQSGYSIYQRAAVVFHSFPPSSDLGGPLLPAQE